MGILGGPEDQNLLLFFKRKSGGNALTAITLTTDGAAVARVLRTSPSSAKLLGCEFKPLDQDPARTLRELVHMQEAAGTRCSALLSPGAYQLLLVEAPDVEPVELRAAIRWRVKDLIDFHIDDAVIDVFDIPGQSRGRTRQMYAVAARASKVKECADRIASTGLELEAIDIEELALRNLTALLPEDARGTALLWFGDDYGLILFTRGGELFLSRRIETGAIQLFSAAQEGDPTSGEFGEHLSELLDQITLEIQRSLDYYDSRFAQPPVHGLVIAPTAPELPFIKDYLARNLSLDIRTLDLSQLFPDAALPDASTQARCLTAIGAALRLEEVKL